ncbi:hypothetical protein JMUB7530_28000 [Staphylococcus aureus]
MSRGLGDVYKRQALPQKLTHSEAVKSSAISNTMICALAQHNYELAGKLLSLIHI